MHFQFESLNSYQLDVSKELCQLTSLKLQLQLSGGRYRGWCKNVNILLLHCCVYFRNSVTELRDTIRTFAAFRDGDKHLHSVVKCRCLAKAQLLGDDEICFCCVNKWRQNFNTRSPPFGESMRNAAPLELIVASNIMFNLSSVVILSELWPSGSTVCRWDRFNALLCSIHLHFAAYLKQFVTSFPVRL